MKTHQRDSGPSMQRMTSSDSNKKVQSLKLCRKEGCENVILKKSQVMCKEHKDQCSARGCKLQGRNEGFCISHYHARGTKLAVGQPCRKEGCNNWNHKKSQALCKEHKGQCYRRGCENKFKEDGLCKRHATEIRKKRCTNAARKNNYGLQLLSDIACSADAGIGPPLSKKRRVKTSFKKKW